MFEIKLITGQKITVEADNFTYKPKFIHFYDSKGENEHARFVEALKIEDVGSIRKIESECGCA